MANRSSAQINAEIYSIAPALFSAVRAAVIEHATLDRTPSVHQANQRKLTGEVERVLAEAIPRDLNHRELWQVMWQRIVYAGTRSKKANDEIKSMRELVPLFADLANYEPGRYVFDEVEWSHFSDQWRSRLPAGKQASWIRMSKESPEWNPGTHFAGARTTPEVWKILTKDDASYPGLQFSALRHKVKRYFSIAEQLHRDSLSGKRPLDHFMYGYQFSPEHKFGNEWLQEREALALVQARFEDWLGNMTALHTMMDLGLKTIKPDRVMTYLFSQLGWLQTLPSALSKEQVLSVYTDVKVVEEMTARADVFAASLARAGHDQAHRLLDIWMVKYGQEPEPAFGITVNLQSNGLGIRGLVESLDIGSVVGKIDEHEAAGLWPMSEFKIVGPRATGANAEKSAHLNTTARIMRRADAEKLFVEFWRAAYIKQPNVYPGRDVGIENRPKEEILRKIERGMQPEEAFQTILQLECDD